VGPPLSNGRHAAIATIPIWCFYPIRQLDVVTFYHDVKSKEESLLRRIDQSGVEVGGVTYDVFCKE